MPRLILVILAAVPLTAGAGSSRAADWIIGATDPNEVVTQTTDRTVDGDIVILNNARLDVEGAVLTVSGDIYVLNSAALNFTAGTLRFVQAYAYQRKLAAADAASVRFTDAVVSGDGHSYGNALLGTAAVDFTRVTVENGFATWTLGDDATLVMADCTNGGEFLPLGQNTLTISGTDTVLFWLALPDASVVNVAFPPPGTVASWSVDPNSPWASGIPYTVSLANCTTVWWGVMAQSGCDGTFRDSTLRVVGSYFKRSNTVTVSGVANNAFLADTSYAWGDVALRFVNTSVQTWNFYSFGSTLLTLESTLFGEVLASENGQAWVMSSMCDGSGGYVGASGSGRVVLASSTNLSQTTSSDDAWLISFHSALLSPTIDAADNSVMQLLNTEYVGEPAAHDAATIFDAAVDPVEGIAGQALSLRGTARMVLGPTSPFTFEGYSLEYGVGQAPTTWIPIGGPFPQEVRDATLGTWDTCALPPGDRSVQVSLLHNLGDPVAVAGSASLADGGLPLGDLDCDGDVDLNDFMVFAACFGLSAPNPPACPAGGFFGSDMDANGNVDLNDFLILAGNFTG